MNNYTSKKWLIDASGLSFCLRSTGNIWDNVEEDTAIKLKDGKGESGDEREITQGIVAWIFRISY